MGTVIYSKKMAFMLAVRLWDARKKYALDTVWAMTRALKGVPELDVLVAEAIQTKVRGIKK